MQSTVKILFALCVEHIDRSIYLLNTIQLNVYTYLQIHLYMLTHKSFRCFFKVREREMVNLCTTSKAKRLNKFTLHSIGKGERSK